MAAAAPETSSAHRKLLAFLDVDIDGWRAAYALAQQFVKNTNLRYNLTSNVLEELGGGEKKRIRQTLFPNDYEWSSKGKIVTRRRPERLVFELFPDAAPLACENFVALLTGAKGKGDCGKPLHYLGCKF